MGNQANDCCWIILATTGCSTSDAVKAKPSGRTLKAAASADCCWIIVATTACTTSDITDSPKLENVTDDCCWIIVATTGCSTR